MLSLSGRHQAQLLNKASIREEIKTKPMMYLDFSHLFSKPNRPVKEKHVAKGDIQEANSNTQNKIQ